MEVATGEDRCETQKSVTVTLESPPPDSLENKDLGVVKRDCHAQDRECLAPVELLLHKDLGAVLRYCDA